MQHRSKGIAMKKTLANLAFIGLCATFLAMGAAGQKSGDNNPASSAAVVGDWHGTSLCLVKPSACHDEEALYHVMIDKAGKLSVQADKIVDGKPVAMGTIGCSYDDARKLLHCEWKQGILDLT